jgi:hypothetical protein
LVYLLVLLFPTFTSPNSLSSEPSPCISNYKACITKTHSWYWCGSVGGLAVCWLSKQADWQLHRKAHLTGWAASTHTVRVQVKEGMPDAEPIHTGPQWQGTLQITLIQ